VSDPAETAGPRASWLDGAIRQVLSLPVGPPLREGTQALALQLLRSIEAETLPVPAVYSTSRGTIRITWDCGQRMLLVSVTGPERFRCRRMEGGLSLPLRSIRRDRVEEMRRLVAWLAPSANRIFVNVYLLKGRP
jgi:hypothetical protein